MNNDRGVSGERRESHTGTLQWCSSGQSPTPTLKQCKLKYEVNTIQSGPFSICCAAHNSRRHPSEDVYYVTHISRIRAYMYTNLPSINKIKM